MIALQVKQYRLDIVYHEFNKAIPIEAWPKPTLIVYGESVGEAIVQGIVNRFGNESGNYTAQIIEGTHNQYSIRKDGYKVATFHLVMLGSITVKDGKEQ